MKASLSLLRPVILSGVLVLGGSAIWPVGRWGPQEDDEKEEKLVNAGVMCGVRAVGGCGDVGGPHSTVEGGWGTGRRAPRGSGPSDSHLTQTQKWGFIRF